MKYIFPLITTEVRVLDAKEIGVTLKLSDEAIQKYRELLEQQMAKVVLKPDKSGPVFRGIQSFSGVS